MRDDAPAAVFIVDEVALYRLVGSPEVMAAQMRQLAAVASMPKVTLQVLPLVAHPANASGFVIADGAVYAEHVVGGFVYPDAETASTLALRFDSLRAEGYRASESLALIDRTCEQWSTGVLPRTQMPTAGTA
jgi:hypothetical protein